ncbi:MAG TPA: sigma-54-dependent Fis family transcriptional regulator [Desulfobulbus sp.]|nr:sigma-54-dependent Fis family transcriptional regulator [Desulfobulbus sp.]
MKVTLSQSERTFLARVSGSIFANPFCGARHQSDCRLTGLSEQEQPKTVLNSAIKKVGNKVRQLADENRANLAAYSGGDRQLAANLFLFHLFHSYLPQLDRHILAQEATIDPIPLECGRALENDLKNFGISELDADKYIALFFQMRRAFYFINNSLIGCSPCMESLRARLWNTVFTYDIDRYARTLWDKLEDFSTLLLGETGTGKGLAAAAIGRSGFIPYNRRKKCFVISFGRAFLSINLSQFPEQLIESELFGHARGSFTGAISDHEGIFARSSGHGAVFLDEIGEVSIPTQIKLLRILQERSFSPVGSIKSQRFDGRIIGATNRDLDQLMNRGKFREDFYFRLCTDVLTIPSLRQRIAENHEELSVLTTHLLQKITGQVSDTLQRAIFKELNKPAFREYSWPGNVRELEQAVRRILLHGTFRRPGTPRQKKGFENELLRQQLSVAKLTSRYCRILFNQYGTLQAVARITGLDRRTVKKYLES